MKLPKIKLGGKRDLTKRIPLKRISDICKKQPIYNNGFEVVPAEGEKPEKKKPTLKEELMDWLDIACFAIITVVVIFSFFFRVATISGDSMLNTLIGTNPKTGAVGDKVIITNLGYEPKNGDIVVISRNIENSAEAQESSNEPIIKRVIAVGGQTVFIDFEKATVYVDGVALKEDYISSPTDDKWDVQFPLYVPEGYIFVLGDNRGESLDSRHSQIGENGLVDTRYVLGHAIYRIFPLDRIGRIE